MRGEDGKIWFGAGIDYNQLEADARKSSQIIQGIGNTAEAEGARIDNSFKRVAVAAGAIFSAQQVMAFGQSIIRTRGEIESYEISFNTLLGSAEKGKAIFSELKDYAVNTPLLLGDLASGAQMLLSFNVEAERVMPILKQIGDISMGDAQKFNSLTLAFSQMSSTGKLMGQDLLQMINAGFNPLTIISEKTGKSIGELKKEMEGGAISADMVADAFAAASAEGGKFHGMLEKQSKGINGMKSNLQGAVDDMFNDLGTKSQSAISIAIGGATELVKHYEAIGKALGALIAVYGAHKAALIAQDVFYKSADKAKYVASTLAEGDALKGLETAEIREQLAKQGMKAGSVEYAAALKAEIVQKYESQKVTYQLAAAEATAAQAAYKAALQRSLTAKQAIWRRETDLVLAKAEGNQSKINLAQTELQAAMDERAAASKAKKAAAAELANKNAIKEAASTAMTTTQTALDTATTSANTAAKSLGAKITGLMTVATKKLTAALMSNVWTLALTAIVALGYGIYKLITYQTEAEKWQGKLNERFREFNAETTAEQIEIDRLFGKLDAAKKGTKEYDQAKQSIIDKYGSYLKGLGDEVERLNDVTRAYEAISAAAKQAALDRAISDARSEATDTYKEKQTEHLDDLKEAIAKKITNTRDAEALYQTIVRDLREGNTLSDDAYKIVQRMSEKNYNRGADGINRISYKNPIQDAVDELKNDNKALDAAFADIEKKFGIQSNNYLQMTSAQIEEVIKKNEELIASGKSTISVTLDQARAKEALAKVKAKEDYKDETVAERKARWSKELAAAEVKLKQLKSDNSTATEEEIEKQKQLVDKLKKSLGLDSTTLNAQNKEDNTQNRQKVEAAERQREIHEYGRKVAEQITQAEIEIAQAQIEAMEDGNAKEMAQIDLNYKKLIAANQQRETEMVKALQEAERLAWENDNPNYKNEGKVFKPTLTKNDLSAGQKDTLESYTEVANNYREKAEADVLKKMLAQYQNFANRRNKINEKYDKDSAALEAQKTSEQFKKVADDMQQMFGNGNADLLARPLIDAVELVKKGWEDAGEGIATVYSSQFSVEDSTGKKVEILVSPILPDGSVLSPGELEDYVDNVLNGADDILKSDTKKLILTVGVDESGEAGDKLHQLQEKYYNLKKTIESGTGNDNQIGDALVVVEQKRQEDLEAIDAEIAKQEASFNVWADSVTSLGLKQLKSALQTARATLNQGGSKMDEKEKAVLRTKIKTLEKQVNIAEAKDANQSSAEKSKKKWDKTLKTMNEVQEAVDNICNSFEGLDETTKTALTAATNIAGGTIAMIMGIQALSKASAEGIKTVEKASVILAIIGAAVQILSALFSLSSKADKEHQEALKEIAENKLKMQREYNKLLLEQKLLMKEAESVFGVDEIAKAARAIDVYRESLTLYKDELKGTMPEKTFWEKITNDALGTYQKRMEEYQKGVGALSNVTVKTGSYTTGAWFWKKQHDVMTSVLKVYPDLLDGENNLNVERAKAIVETQTMSDENKALLQNLIDLQEQAEKAQEELRNYLEDTFGSLGDGMMDSIVYAIENDGVDAWEKFGEKGSEVLEDLGKQIAYSLFFSEKFKKLQADLEKIYGSGKSEEDIAKDARDLIGNFYQGIGQDMDSAQSWMEQWKEEAKKQGFDLWGSEREASSKGIATASQDSVDELNGRMTAVQGHTYSISENMKLLIEISSKMLEVLSGIKDNTEHCKRLEKIEEDMSAVKDGIDTINLKGITLKR